MSQRRLPFIDDEPPLPVRRGDSWLARWSRVIENPAADACAPCKGSGWGAFFPGGGTVCKACGGSGQRPRTKRIQLL